MAKDILKEATVAIWDGDGGIVQVPARLALASPGLLDALRNVAFTFHREMAGRNHVDGKHYGDYDDCVSPVCEMNRAAIAKAEGK